MKYLRILLYYVTAVWLTATFSAVLVGGIPAVGRMWLAFFHACFGG